jgi:hypothetical protein
MATDKKSFTATATANPIQVMTPTVGTVTVSYWVRTNGVLAATAAETVTITVRANVASQFIAGVGCRVSNINLLSFFQIEQSIFL